MHMTESGILSPFAPGATSTVRTFPSLTALSNGTLLAVGKVGTKKDSDDGTIEFFRSADNGQTWSEPEDLGFTDQAAHPAVLADGRTVLCWGDRFHSHSIRARLALNISAPFKTATEIEIYRHQLSALKNTEDNQSPTTGDVLEDMRFWSYGLPYAAALPNGDVMVLYYAGDGTSMNIHWSRIVL